MSLNSFITHVKQIGLPLASHYEVIVPVVDGSSSSNAQTVSLLCNSATLPGHNIMTTELRIFGESSERPHGINYSPVSLTFIIDNDFSAMEYFNNWSALVFNRETREIGYYNDFTRDIEIIVYNKADEEIRRIKLYEAYPKTIQDLQADYSQHQVMNLTVQMVYKWWETISKSDNKVTNKTKEIDKDLYPTYGDGGLEPSNESLGNFTSSTSSGKGLEVNPGIPSFGDPGTAFQQAGTNIISDSKRSLLQAGNLFGVSSMSAPGFTSAGGDLAGLTSTLASGFKGFGDGIGALGSTASLPTTLSSLSSSTSSIAYAASNVATIMNGFGGAGSEINQSVGDLLRVSSYLNSVSETAELPNYLNSISSSMNSIGSNINNSISPMKANSSFDRSAEVAFKYMSSVFANTGTILSQATNSISK